MIDLGRVQGLGSRARRRTVRTGSHTRAAVSPREQRHGEIPPPRCQGGAPFTLFPTRIYLGGTEQPSRSQYAVAPDGRFLINTVVGNDAVAPIIVIHNWRGKKTSIPRRKTTTGWAG